MSIFRRLIVDFPEQFGRFLISSIIFHNAIEGNNYLLLVLFGYG